MTDMSHFAALLLYIARLINKQRISALSSAFTAFGYIARLIEKQRISA